MADAVHVSTGVKGTEVLDPSLSRNMIKSCDREGDRPFVVYLTSSSEKNATNQALADNTVLRDERVMISAKLFTMVKADGDAIGPDHPFAQHIGGGALPRFVVFAADGTRLGKVEGRTSPGKVGDLMAKAIAKDFVNGDKFDAVIVAYQKVLTSIDKLEALKLALNQKDERDDSPAAKREIAKRRTQLDATETDLRAQEEKILQLQRKQAS